jgi:hypothetical protein
LTANAVKGKLNILNSAKNAIQNAAPYVNERGLVTQVVSVMDGMVKFIREDL